MLTIGDLNSFWVFLGHPVLWAPANVGEKHCVVCPERLVAIQESHQLSLNPCTSQIGSKWQTRVTAHVGNS